MYTILRQIPYRSNQPKLLAWHACSYQPQVIEDMGGKIEIAKREVFAPARVELAALGLWDCFGTTKSYEYET